MTSSAFSAAADLVAQSDGDVHRRGRGTRRRGRPPGSCRSPHSQFSQLSGSRSCPENRRKSSVRPRHAPYGVITADAASRTVPRRRKLPYCGGPAAAPEGRGAAEEGGLLFPHNRWEEWNDTTSSRADREPEQEDAMSLLLIALIGLMFGVMIGGGGLATAAKPVDIRVDDYSQCTDGTAEDEFKASEGWINGILNAQNSTYYEERSRHSGSSSGAFRRGSHSSSSAISLKRRRPRVRLTRYVGLHADGADPCQGLNGQVGARLTASWAMGVPLSTTAIPADRRGSVGVQRPRGHGSSNTVTSNHDLDGQKFDMWGGSWGSPRCAAYKGTSPTRRASTTRSW